MLHLLADIALKKPPVKRRPSNPMCMNPLHYQPERDTPRQRQTCFGCIAEDMAILNANPYLARWDVACVLNTICRSYVCGLCFIEKKSAEGIRKAGDCYEHSVYNAQHRCFAHGLRWTECCECVFDVRAGTSMCKFCGLRYSSMCKCPRGPLALRAAVAGISSPQPEEQLRQKERLARSVLEYAAKLQATNGDPDLVDAVKASHVFPDVAPVRSALELNDPDIAEKHFMARRKRAAKRHRSFFIIGGGPLKSHRIGLS